MDCVSFSCGLSRVLLPIPQVPMVLLLQLFIPWVSSQSPTGRASFSDSSQPESLAPCTLAVLVYELSNIHVSVLLFKSTFVLLWQIQHVPIKTPLNLQSPFVIMHSLPVTITSSTTIELGDVWGYFWHLKWALVVTQVVNYCLMGYMGATGVAPNSPALSFLVCQMEIRYNCLFF